MPIVTLNSALVTLRGRLGDQVFKTYGRKIVVTRVPRFDHYVPSAAQRARREQMRAATAYARRVYADPATKALYVAAGRRLGRQPFRLAVSDYLAMPLSAAGTPDAAAPLDSARRERLVRGGALPPASPAPRPPVPPPTADVVLPPAPRPVSPPSHRPPAPQPRATHAPVLGARAPHRARIDWLAAWIASQRRVVPRRPAGMPNRLIGREVIGSGAAGAAFPVSRGAVLPTRGPPRVGTCPGNCNGNSTTARNFSARNRLKSFSGGPYIPATADHTAAGETGTTIGSVALRTG